VSALSPFTRKQGGEYRMHRPVRSPTRERDCLTMSTEFHIYEFIEGAIMSRYPK
jgi:hypothetical protein